jgi:hypothetical protein
VGGRGGGGGGAAGRGGGPAQDPDLGDEKSLDVKLDYKSGMEPLPTLESPVLCRLHDFVQSQR